MKLRDYFKRVCACFVLVTVFGGLFTSSKALDPITLDANSYISVERSKGLVIAEHNPDLKVYPAGTTVLLTALVALDHLKLDDVLTVEADDLKGLQAMGSAIFLKKGEQLTFETALNQVLISGGNDTCNLIARSAAGSIDNFVALMNQKAAELGCTASNFTNTHGLHDENHYTTARDMMKIAMSAANNPTISQIAATTQFKYPANNLRKETTMSSSNHLISKIKDNRYLYKGATGLKTGWTNPSGMCLIATAEKTDMSVITVVMGAKKSPEGDLGSFTETTKLLNYSFDNFKFRTFISKSEPIAEAKIDLAKDGSKVLVLTLETDFSDMMPNDVKKEDLEVSTNVNEGIEAPIIKGQVLGNATISHDGVAKATINLVASKDVERSEISNIISKINDFLSSVVLKIFIAIIFALAAVFFGIRVYNISKKKKKRSGRRSK